MIRHLSAVVGALAVAVPVHAAEPLPAPEAVTQAYMTFCLPMAIKGATLADAQAAAAHLGYTAAELPPFPAMNVRTAPAWRVPSSAGVVTAALGSVNEKLPSSCEVTVSGIEGSAVRKAMEQALVCAGCPFTRNVAMSSNTPQAQIDKYDWHIEDTHMLVSVLTVALPDESKGASFFMHVHRLP